MACVRSRCVEGYQYSTGRPSLIGTPNVGNYQLLDVVVDELASVRSEEGGSTFIPEIRWEFWNKDHWLADETLTVKGNE